LRAFDRDPVHRAVVQAVSTHVENKGCLMDRELVGFIGSFDSRSFAGWSGRDPHPFIPRPQIRVRQRPSQLFDGRFVFPAVQRSSTFAAVVESRLPSCRVDVSYSHLGERER
jgi:hypothetical protein